MRWSPGTPANLNFKITNCRALELYLSKILFFSCRHFWFKNSEKTSFKECESKRGKRVKPREPFFESKTNRNYLARLSQGEYFLLKYDRHKKRPKKESGKV